MTSIDASLDLSVGKRSTLLVLALLGLLTAGLLMLLPGGPVHAQEAGIIRYAENDIGPVRTFTSTDPESAAIRWDVTGTDADDFTIDANGVLEFMKSPDYESPTDREGADGEIQYAGLDNMYQITVRATEVRAPDVTGRALSTESHITVNVINVNEPGVVELSWLQPEVGTKITASLTDPDGMTVSAGETNALDAADRVTLGWQWYTSNVVSPDPMDDTDWDVATGVVAVTDVGSVYTPAGDRVEGATPNEYPNAATDAPVDEGKYLRARVTYTDPQSTDTTAKTAVMMSAYPVRAEVTSRNDGIVTPDNGSPSFKLDTASYSLPEDRAVGSAVGSAAEATDPNRDTLTYELDNDANAATPPDRNEDLGFFMIDKATGQITVAKKLDYEAKAPDGEYTVWVRATDPSGESDDEELTITVEDANDAPEIEGLAEQRVREQDSDPSTNALIHTAYLGVPEPRYTAPDEDEFDEITWSLEGDDADQFLLSAQTQGPNEPRDLKFKTPPDYENPTDSDFDGVYKVVLVATDTERGTDKRPVTIFVDNEYELGSLTLTPEQPLVGERVTVTLADPDEDWAIVTWQWFVSGDTDPAVFTPVRGKTSDTYTPDKDDDGRYLRAEVTYIDSTSEVDDPATLLLDERVQKTGPPTAKELDVDDGTGQDSDRVYRLVVTSEQAVNSEGTETTTDPVMPGPRFSLTSVTREVAENAMVGHYVGAPVVAQHATTYALTSGSHDHTNFVIDGNGQITVADIDTDLSDLIMTRPDLDYEIKPTYSIKVVATGVNNATATAEVTVRLINLNEEPYFTGDSTSPDWTQLINPQEKAYDENSTGAVANYQAVDPDRMNNILWYVYGTDSADFDILGGQLRFKTPPNFEKPTDRPHDEDGEDAKNNTYHVIVRVAEETVMGGGPPKSMDIGLTVTVRNMEEVGTVHLNLLQPEALTEITGTAMDPDDGVSGASYQWYRAKVDDPQVGNVDPDVESTIAAEWTPLSGNGANTQTYRPQEGPAGDVGRHLLVRALYNDTEGAGKAAIGVSAHRVRADVSDEANASPDFESNETTRSVPEDTAVGSPVGSPVIVDVNEDNDILTYELVMDTGQNPAVVGGDLPFFSIDQASGQIKLEKKLSAEQTDGRDYTGEDPRVAGTYTVVVRATDPSGELALNDNRDDITVEVIATDVPEAPRVTGGNAEIEVDEMNSVTDCYVALATRKVLTAK